MRRPRARARRVTGQGSSPHPAVAFERRLSHTCAGAAGRSAVGRDGAVPAAGRVQGAGAENPAHSAPAEAADRHRPEFGRRVESFSWPRVPPLCTKWEIYLFDPWGSRENSSDLERGLPPNRLPMSFPIRPPGLLRYETRNLTVFHKSDTHIGSATPARRRAVALPASRVLSLGSTLRGAALALLPCRERHDGSPAEVRDSSVETPRYHELRRSRGYTADNGGAIYL